MARRQSVLSLSAYATKIGRSLVPAGLRAQVLRRHLRVAHGLDIVDYRARWQLPMDYPLTAPSYSARRSRMAKAIGFGRRRAAAAPSPPATERPATRRRGRPRRTPPAT
jgi:ROS/MUCR transcriptional regulator protein